MEEEKISPKPMLDYPFPIREGQLAYFKLPVDLRKKEVDRILLFLRTLQKEIEES